MPSSDETLQKLDDTPRKPGEVRAGDWLVMTYDYYEGWQIQDSYTDEEARAKFEDYPKGILGWGTLLVRVEAGSYERW